MNNDLNERLKLAREILAEENANFEVVDLAIMDAITALAACNSSLKTIWCADLIERRARFIERQQARINELEKYTSDQTLVEENEKLKAQIAELEARIDELEKEIESIYEDQAGESI